MPWPWGVAIACYWGGRIAYDCFHAAGHMQSPTASIIYSVWRVSTVHGIYKLKVRIEFEELRNVACTGREI